MPIECVTLDLDDTLWDCWSVIDGAERAFYDWLGTRYPDIVARYDSEALVEHRRDTYTRHPDMIHDLTYMRKKWLHRLGDEAGYGDKLVEPGFDVFWHARNSVQLYEGVTELLSDLHAHYRVGAITNGNADVHHIGIGHWFHFVVTAADAGAAKPAADIFHHALAQAETAPGNVVHVGDDPDKDVRGAAEVGMKTVWVNARGDAWPGGARPNAEVRTVDQLAAVVRALN